MLEIRDLVAGYGDSMVFQGLSLKVPDGKLVAVMGSNGVGKSTLLKTVVGIISPRSGEIHYQSKRIDGLLPYQRSLMGIGYVPQGREIFPFLTVHQNLVLGLEARGASNEVVRQAADSMYEVFPALAKVRHRKGGDLSGGQQQILAISRVMICKPSLLILDEPSEGIQPSIVEEISDTLGRIRSTGVSILLVEQFPDFALTHADWYYRMEHGTMVEEGEVNTENRESIRAAVHI